MSEQHSSPLKLSQAVIQAGERLGLVRAEVARILGFRCESITGLYEGRLLLEEGTAAWYNGELFVRFLQLLEVRMAGEEAKMIHWLRRRHPALGNSPFYLIIDEGRLAEVLAYLEKGED